ncbi:hypothetical protein [Bacteroides faecium]|uniref:Cell surface protein n=1 Tax=Bacteroides faecium TaxID=2715212 RepID=A0A6H0KU98_9BACE|nr:hypothetical protein [Bacteroides faecium]QIU96759.1 hypothetical protein BacF7301_22555 [Bacteroides faecium]
MKRKFVKVMFFGALALSTVTYVGCKDYDDDVKGLQEQIDTINKKGADVTTEAMKTAISSAVADLQSQLDAIAGKADKTALEELKAAVQKLQTALEGKASSEDVAALNTKLEEAIGKVDKSIADAVKVAKDQLQAEIDALEEKLGTADGKADENALKLAELEQKMLELDKASGERIAKLELQIAELEGIKTRIKNLEDASANFATMDQLDEYLQTAKDYVDTKMLDYLTSDQVTNKVDAVKTYVDGAFRTTILTELGTTYLSIDSYNEDMEKLTQQISTFVDSQSQEYKDIFVDIKTLMDYKKDVLEVLVKNLSDPNNNTIQKANDCYNALNGITDVKDELAKCAKTSDLSVYLKSADLNKEIDDHLKATFASYDSSIKEIGTKVETLTGAVKDMLKSLVFLPQEYDENGLVRKVEFISYYTTDDASTAANAEGQKETIGSVLISNEVETKVRFRVSPATAVDALVAENSKYTITTDKHIVKSRSVGAPFEVTGVSKVKKSGSETEYEEGVIEVTLNIGSASESYAIALYVTGNDETTKLTEITSDYFAAIIGKSYVKNVTYSNATTGRGDVMYDDNVNGLSFFTAATSENDGSEYYSVTLSDKDGKNEKTATSLSGMNIPTDLFNVTFALDGANKEHFTLKDGLLKKTAESALEDVCTVTPTVTMTVGNKTASYAGTAETVTVKSRGAETTVTLDNKQIWNTGEKTYNLQAAAIKAILDEINKATGEKYKKLSDVSSAIAEASGSVKHEADGKVDVEVNNDDVVVTVQGEFSGTAVPYITFDFGNTLVIKVLVSVTVNKPEFKALNAEKAVWDGRSVLPMISAVGGNPLAVTLTRNLGILFVKSEWDNLIAEAKAGNVELKTVLTAGKKTGNEVGTVAISGENSEIYTFTNNKSNTDEVTVKFVLYCGDEAKPEDEIATVGTVELIAPDMTGDLQAPTEDEDINIIKGNLAETTNLLANFTWNDSRKKEMWPELAQDFGDGINSAADALGVYGLNVTYTVVDEGSNRADFEKYFDKTGYIDGVLTEDAVKDIKLNSTYNNLETSLDAPIQVVIEIKAASSWGQAITNGTTRMSITYPKGTAKK